ncbi:MAG: hypothetical protein QOE89_934 [Pseudonocardiales bacterium]|jgi:hypothetical protein|nr:hypothetical protein [Pseudonocardiales bacterium]
MTENNSHAGQGSVLLDIGDDIGALVLMMPTALEGCEIEVRPVGSHGPDEPHPVHVGVVGRPVDNRMQYSAVFGQLQEGSYEVYLRPDGPVRLSVSVAGGQVSEANWPGVS